MKLSCSVRVVSAAAFWLAAVVVCASQDAPPPAPEKTTLAGVYTAPQAEKGGDTFATLCTGCHKVSSHSGQPFKTRWLGKPLAELYQLIKDTMPEDAAGSLTPGEAAQLVAFLLKANGLPAGTAELPPDAAVLKTIRIELPVK